MSKKSPNEMQSILFKAGAMLPPKTHIPNTG